MSPRLMVLRTKKASKNKLERLCSQCILSFLNHIVKVDEDYISQNLHKFFEFGLSIKDYSKINYLI